MIAVADVYDDMLAMIKSELWGDEGTQDEDRKALACEKYLRKYRQEKLLRKILDDDDKREVYHLFRVMFRDIADNVEILELIDSGFFVLADSENEDPPFMMRTRFKYGGKKLWGKAP